MDGHSLKTKPSPSQLQRQCPYRADTLYANRPNTGYGNDCRLILRQPLPPPKSYNTTQKKERANLHSPFPKEPQSLLIKRILPSQLHTDHPIHFPNLLQVPPNIIAYLPDLLFFKGGFLRSFPFSLKQSQNLLTL